MDGKLFKAISFMSTSDRIAKLFSDCKAEHRAAFVAYVCSCDPDFNRSLDVCKTLIDQGVDLLELGVPFSDPLAKGSENGTPNSSKSTP